MPIDLIPDFIPFFGEIDDVFLLVLALQRLVENAGRAVLLDHWTGEPADLADLNLRGALTAAAFLLPALAIGLYTSTAACDPLAQRRL